jgi:hypothetical protein
MELSRANAATEAKYKLYFYVVALAFTTVGFATQSAPEYGTILERVSELVAWIFLLVSGLTGLLFLERHSDYETMVARYEHLASRRKQARLDKKAGIQSVLRGKTQELSIDSEIEGLHRAMLRATEIMDEHYARKSRFDGICRWSLALGYVCLVISRGTPKFQAIIELAER